jgi:hypothetical protein
MRRTAFVLSAVWLSVIGCGQLAGLPDFKDSARCPPGSVRSCFSGPEGTEGVGLCRAGQQTCNPDGDGYGPCSGEILPRPEDCAVAQDEDCDGQHIDKEDGCACEPDVAAPCFSGPPALEGVGLCEPGVAVCNKLGTAYGDCIGEVLPAAEKCATAGVDEDCDGDGACTGAIEWSRRFGDASGQVSMAVATDSAGNVVIVGNFEGSLDFGAGALMSVDTTDAFVAKLDASGGHLWSKGFRGTGDQTANRVATDSAGNVIVAGYFVNNIDLGEGSIPSAGAGDIFVAKLDPAGALIWNKTFGDASGQSLSALAIDGDDAIVIAGYPGTGVDFGGGSLAGAGQSDGFVAKLDSSGKHLWSKRFVDAGAGDIAFDSAEGVVLLGKFSGSVDFGGGPLTAVGSFNTFILKLDAQGVHTWSKRFGSADELTAVDMAVDSAGNLILVGSFVGSVDFGGGPMTGGGDLDIFVAKLDGAGDHIWTKPFGYGSGELANSVAVDGEDNIVFSGWLLGSLDFGGDVLTSAGIWDTFVAKLDASGKHIWSDRFGDETQQYGQGVATDSLNNVVIAGQFLGRVDFGEGDLESVGGFDIFVAKFAP